jgi:subtilisin family serine protease
MAEAWDWCVTHQNDDPSNPIMIITTSFGGGRYIDYCDSAAGSLASAAANAKAAGITLFVASGNEFYCDALASPACISHVISVGAVYDASLGTYQWCVGAGSCIPNQGIPSTCSIGTYAVNDTTSTDKVTSYSNSASFLSLLAPSHNAYTLGLGTSSFVATFGGTSAACPYAAGAAAALQSAAKAIKASWLTPDQIKYYLTGSGDIITDTKNGISKPRVNLSASIDDLNALPISKKPDLGPILILLLDED